jgi:tRNA-dihydrouridine synthase B
MKTDFHPINKQVVLAPMAGITDRPFRQLCRGMGADAATSEMISCNPALAASRKTRLRVDHDGEDAPRIVQIAGADPGMMAAAARYNIDQGADIIDINMGCPAKKVCNTMAGSALLRDEPLVGRILEAVVNASTVPVTLKIRTGWDKANRNAARIAAIAETAGISRLTVHGRSRACAFRGEAEYDTIAAVKERVSIPVYANGDIDSAQKALKVLRHTGADGVMIGRAAQGNPWLFRQIKRLFATGAEMQPPTTAEIGRMLLRHLDNLYGFYGEDTGVRVARKHIGWYCRHLHGGEILRQLANRAQQCREQLQLVGEFFLHGRDPVLERAA